MRSLRLSLETALEVGRLSFLPPTRGCGEDLYWMTKVWRWISLVQSGKGAGREAYAPTGLVFTIALVGVRF